MMKCASTTSALVLAAAKSLPPRLRKRALIAGAADTLWTTIDMSRLWVRVSSPRAVRFGPYLGRALVAIAALIAVVHVAPEWWSSLDTNSTANGDAQGFAATGSQKHFASGGDRRRSAAKSNRQRLAVTGRHKRRAARRGSTGGQCPS